MTTISKRIALARRKTRNALLDLRYGGLLRGPVDTGYADQGAHGMHNTPYDVLAKIFTPGTIGAGDVLVDVGCGKGRVINWWLRCAHRNRIIGIELDPEMADQARRRLRRHGNVSIICGDAIENLPREGTVFYLYNPFEASVLRAFRDRLAELLDDSRRVRIYYYHPIHIAVFEDDPRWEVVDRWPVLQKYWPEMEVAVVEAAQSPR
jgi:SAM-dependent methyltransferase